MRRELWCHLNGCDFFMRHVGSKLLRPDQMTGKAIADTATALTVSMPLYTGSSLRLSSCWMIVSESKVVTTFKALHECGFDTSGSTKQRDATIAALKSGKPSMLLQFSKATMSPADLFITYDARVARLCSPGNTKTFDATEWIEWTR